MSDITHFAHTQLSLKAHFEQFMLTLLFAHMQLVCVFKVKSVVVPVQHPPSSKPAAAAPLSKQTAYPTEPSPKVSKVPQASNCITSLKRRR